MIVIPAIDILGGRCVQLTQGRLGTEKSYGDPVKTAKGWEGKGAKALHVIDLDAAFGRGDNLSKVSGIRSAVRIPIQFGGGMRTAECAQQVLDAGIDRVIVGSAAVKDPGMVTGLSQRYGKDRIMVAVDSAGGRVVVKGWTEKTGIRTTDLIERFKPYVFGFLLTDVDKEGVMGGIDAQEFMEVQRFTKARICASGGITTESDIKALERIGVWGCVVGKALYEGAIRL